MENQTSNEARTGTSKETSPMDEENVYNKMNRLGLNYGAAMRRAKNIRRGSRINEDAEVRHFSSSEVELSMAERARHPVPYSLPPPVLDAAFNVSAAARFEELTFLAIPMSIEELMFFPPKKSKVCEPCQKDNEPHILSMYGRCAH